MRLVGSGVDRRIDNRLFVATASHVATASGSLRTAYPEDVMRSLPVGRFWCLGDWADVCVAELSEELPTFSPITKSEIRDYRALPKGMTLSALGYPESKSRIYASIADCLLLSVVSQEKASSVQPTEDEFQVKAKMIRESARDLNRTLLSALHRVEKKTRLRAKWAFGKSVERFFDFMPKGSTRG